MENQKSQEMLNNEEETILMSDDNGMGNNKVTYGFEGKYYQIDFPSMFKEVDRVTIDTTVIDGRIFTFSEGRLAVENGHQTKDDEIHEILLKKAIYEVYKKTGVKSFDIVTNYSLDSYKEDGGKKVLERMSKIKTIKVKELYKEDVELKVNRLDCYPVCVSGGVLVDLNLREEDVVFIDMGTRNLQLLRMVKGVPKYEISKSTKKGMSSIYRGIADITKTMNLGVDDAVAVEFYLKKTNEGKLEPIAAIEDKILEYLMTNVFNEIDQCLDEMEVSTLFTKYVFLGGGSNALGRFLDAKFVKDKNSQPIYVNNPYFATSLGLFKKGERIYNYEKHTACSKKNTSKTTTSKTTKANKDNDSKKVNQNS